MAAFFLLFLLPVLITTFLIIGFVVLFGDKSLLFAWFPAGWLASELVASLVGARVSEGLKALLGAVYGLIALGLIISLGKESKAKEERERE